MRILGLIVFVFAIIVGVGFNLSPLLNAQTFIIVFGSTIGMLMFSRLSIPTMLKAVFSSAASIEELQEGVKGWQLAGAYSLASGGIGTLIGLVLMLKNMSDPAAIGPAMAIAFTCIFYGFVLSFGIYLPLQSCLEDRIEE